MSATLAKTIVKSKQQEVRPDPQWYAEYRSTYLAGVSHAFLIHGDIEGLAYEDADHRLILLANLGERSDVVAVWHLASGGVTLYGENDTIVEDGKTLGTRRELAEKIVSPPGQPGAAAASGGGAVAALAAQAGPQAGRPDVFKNARQPMQALALLQTLLLNGKRIKNGRMAGTVSVVIDYADALVPAPAMAGKGAMSEQDRTVLVTLLAWARDKRIDDLGNSIFLLARDKDEIHPDIRSTDSGWRQIRIEHPTRDARKEYLDWYLEVRRRGNRPIALREGLSTAEVANLTAGLNLRNLEDILLSANTEGGLTRATLKLYKDRIIRSEYSEVAEMIEPLAGGFRDLGGSEVFKDYCQRRIIRAIRENRLNSVPRGIILVGPPGTSKTYGVRGLAGEISFAAVALNAAKILGGIVGQSERNLEKFMSFARALAPCIVFVDEFDQSDMAQRGDQSGNPVAKNLFNALLQFMSDETLRGKVIVMMASNRPDKIDPAMKRSGRIDAIVPMLLPERDDRREIARVQAKIQGIGIDDSALDYIADNSAKWNAGDLAEVVREARLRAEDERLDTISLAIATFAMEDLMPAGLDTADQFTRIAIESVNKRSLLPPSYAELRANPEALAKEIAENVPTAWEGAGRSERQW